MIDQRPRPVTPKSDRRRFVSRTVEAKDLFGRTIFRQQKEECFGPPVRPFSRPLSDEGLALLGHPPRPRRPRGRKRQR